MDVDLQGDTRTLADEMMLKSFEGFGVNIFEVSRNSIKLEFIPKSDPQDRSPLPQDPGHEWTTTHEDDGLGVGSGQQ
mgnify:CR=1 FL=1